MDILLGGPLQGLISSVDPLGMILSTLMLLLSDALAKVATGMYSALFEVTTVDFSQAAVGSIWKITTGVSISLATILLILAAFRSMVAQSNRCLLEALPGVVLAVVGPQAATVILPWIAAACTDLAQVIVATATPDLAASMRLLAGVGPNPIYTGLGLLAPMIAAMMLFGMFTVFFVLLFCMAGAVVLYALSPFAFAGLVMAPTRTWFTKWATAMFSLLFAKVPIAILLALSVSLFANSAHAGIVQSFVNAAAGLILGIGALLAPLMAYGLFSFMGAAATRPAVPTGSPTRALGSAYYGTQMGRASVNAVRTAVAKVRGGTTTPSGGGGGQPGSASASGPTPGPTPGPAPREPSASARAAGAQVTGTPSPATGSAAGRSAARGSTAAGSAAGSTGAAASGTAGVAGSAGTAGAAGTTGAAVAAGSATAGVGAVAVVAAQAGRKAAKTSATRAKTAGSRLTAPAGFTERDSGLLVPNVSRGHPDGRRGT